MKKTQKPLPKEGCFTMVIIVIVLALTIIVIRSCFFNDLEIEKKEIFKATKIDAYVHSQLCVERYLKNPGSAEYTYNELDVNQKNDSTFYVVTYVDAHNSFGALGRIYYQCTVIFDKNGNSKCKDMKVEEN